MAEVGDPEHTERGTRSLGPYLIQSELGAGAMGTVHLALHTGLDRSVALKMLHPDMLQDEGSVRRFLREARSIARLDHPHIVAVYDAGVVDGVYYIAMKLLEGHSLQTVIKEGGPLSTARIVNIGSQLASALGYAHAREVVHLDVKPANVMISGSDHVVLTDFGISQAVSPGATRSAVIAGTPLYMSPEQIQGREPDTRSDIYSLGLVLYEMAVGRPPFQGQMITVMYSHLHTPIPNVREHAPDIPPGLAAIIDRALEKDPDERYQVVHDLQRALEQLGDTIPAETDRTFTMSPNDGAEDIRRAARRGDPAAVKQTTIKTVGGTSTQISKIPILAGAAVVLVVGAGAAFYLTRGGSASGNGNAKLVSSPAGALVSIDGKQAGRAPITLNNLTGGTHKLTFSLPTYLPKAVSVSVSGGKTTDVSVSLTSVPVSGLVQIDEAVLVRSLTVDSTTHKVNLGQKVTQVSSSHVEQTPVFPVAALHLDSGVPASRTVTFQGHFDLVDPNGLLLASSPDTQISMNHQNPHALISARLRLKAVTGRQATLGTWKVYLRANGNILRTLTFRIVR